MSQCSFLNVIYVLYNVHSRAYNLTFIIITEVNKRIFTHYATSAEKKKKKKKKN